MSWRTVLISGRAKLDLKLNHMVVRKADTYKIHIDEIAIVIIDSTSVSITTSLIDRLVEKKVKLIFCGKDHNPIGEVVNYHNKHNSVKMIQKQMNWETNSKGKVWRKIIEEKINNQSRVLKDINYFSYELLQEYLDEIKDFDSTNREGHAAKVYFYKLFGCDFSRRAENPINSMLNYGYSIILSLFTREITSLGYLTQVGIFHENQFNYYNLASDFMEPLRPLIDMIVLNYMPEKFEREEKEELLKIFEISVVVEGINHTLLNAINVYTRSLFNALEFGDENLIKFIDYDL